MEERCDDEDAVASAQLEAFVVEVSVAPHTRAVAQHGALGVTGGARGEHHIAHVLGPDRLDPRHRLALQNVMTASEEGIPRRRARAIATHADGVGQGRHRRIRAAEHVEEVDTEKAVSCQHGSGARASQYVGRLGPLEARIEWHQPGAGRVDAQGGRDPRRGVGSPQRHPVTRPDPARHEGTAYREHAGAHLGEGQGGVAVNHRHLVGKALPIQECHTGDRAVLRLERASTLVYHSLGRSATPHVDPHDANLSLS